MSQEMRCPKCSSEMRRGELFINVSGASSGERLATPLDLQVGSTIAIPEVVTGDGPYWRERTGQKTGWLVKRDEIQVLKIYGLRCTECNYIELYSYQ